MSHSHRHSPNSRCLSANSSTLWCHFGGETRRQQSVTQRQGGLSPLKPQEDHTAAVFGHPPSAGQVSEVVPSRQPKMSPPLFTSDWTGVGFFECWWCISMRLFKIWGFSVWRAELMKTSFTVPMMAVCGVVNTSIWEAGLWGWPVIIEVLIPGQDRKMCAEIKLVLSWPL